MPRAKTEWKRQVVLKLVCSADARGILDDTEKYILGRAGGKGVETECLELATAAAPAAADRRRVAELVAWLGAGRLYVVGHGDWRNQRVGDWDPETVAGLVGVQGAAYPVVSVTGCRVGRDLPTADNPRQAMPEGVYLANSMNSFASRLHALLKDCGAPDVYARVWGAQANKRPTLLTMADDIEDAGRAPTGPMMQGVIAAVAGRKLRFYWQGGQQAREWVDLGVGVKQEVDF